MGRHERVGDFDEFLIANRLSILLCYEPVNGDMMLEEESGFDAVDMRLTREDGALMVGHCMRS